MLTVEKIPPLLPDWVDGEVKYANRKHGSINPFYSIFSGGLHDEGPAIMDFMNYIGKAIKFEDNEGERIISLMCAQAVSKLLSCNTALLNVFAERRSQHPNIAVAYDLETKQWIADTIPYVALRPPKSMQFHVQLLINSAEDIAKDIDRGDLLGAEELAKALYVDQTSFVVGQLTLIGCMAAPGLPSGEVEEWQSALAA